MRTLFPSVPQESGIGTQILLIGLSSSWADANTIVFLEAQDEVERESEERRKKYRSPVDPKSHVTGPDLVVLLFSVFST